MKGALARISKGSRAHRRSAWQRRLCARRKRPQMTTVHRQDPVGFRTVACPHRGMECPLARWVGTIPRVEFNSRCLEDMIPGSSVDPVRATLDLVSITKVAGRDCRQQGSVRTGHSLRPLHTLANRSGSVSLRVSTDYPVTANALASATVQDWPLCRGILDASAERCFAGRGPQHQCTNKLVNPCSSGQARWHLRACQLKSHTNRGGGFG